MSLISLDFFVRALINGMPPRTGAGRAKAAILGMISMPIYDRSTKDLMHEFAKAVLKPGQVFTTQLAKDWFAENYPKLRPNTVDMHVRGMVTNDPQFRKSHPSIKPGANWDLFFKLGPGQYRLWDQTQDPEPIYPTPSDSKVKVATADSKDDDDEVIDRVESKEFAYERDLKNYLAKNLNAIEPGLKLFQDEGFSGLEYPVGGRFIDILALDKANNFVVIELKVSRGYDRTVGQLLRYMAWINENLADGKEVRGIIVASEISEDLKLAASMVSKVRMIEYEIDFRLKPVNFQ